MESSKKTLPMYTVNEIRKLVDTNPDYQRPAVWTMSQKQLLVDTVLRGYDIPKLYWRRVGRKPEKFEVIDGQQRLRALWGFAADEFPLPRDSDPVDGVIVAGSRYGDLSVDLLSKFHAYPLDVVVIDDAEDDEIREMFLRLQNGTTLRAQEKRNAYPGAMRDFVRSLSSHGFFNSVGFTNSRLTFDLVAAQMVRLELAGGPTNVKNRDLNKMYLDETDFDPNGAIARKVRTRLSLLHKLFPEETPELSRYNSIALYATIAELMSNYVRRTFESIFHQWFLGFESKRRAQDTLSEEHAEPGWVQYKEKISHSTDSEDSIRWRMDFMLKDLLLEQPRIEIKDAQRGFTHQQRLAVFRRDGGRCQLGIGCGSATLKWGNWHCDHKIPWSEGGKTCVANAQVACPECNIAKSNRV